MPSSTACSICSATWYRRPSTDSVGCVHLNLGTTRLLHEDFERHLRIRCCLTCQYPPAKLRRSGTIAVYGVRVTISELLQRSGVSRATYQRRLRNGWSQARAARTPPGRSGRPDAKTQPSYKYGGKRMSLLAWSTRLGIKYRTLLQRINRGLSFEEAIEHKFYGRLPKS